MAQRLALEIFGAQLLVKRTFLEFCLQPAWPHRSLSAPAICHHPPLQQKPQLEKPTKINDDDALAEFRRETIRELWEDVSKKLIETKEFEASRILDRKRMKLRTSLPMFAFAQLLHNVRCPMTELVTLRRTGSVRDVSDDEVQLYFTDSQLEKEALRRDCRS